MSTFAVPVVRIEKVEKHPNAERFDRRLGRVITKLIGEQHLLRKGGTEYQ